MKIYTKTGDSGETGLVGGKRVRKNCARVIAYGAIDELNAALGTARSELARSDLAATDQRSKETADLDNLLARLQHQLFNVGAELASDSSSTIRAEWIDAADIDFLEAEIDSATERLEPLKQFILPGGCPLAAQLHLARCVCRRGEQVIVTLADKNSDKDDVRPEVLAYVNRLSDLLFVLARTANRMAGLVDVVWEK